MTATNVLKRHTYSLLTLKEANKAYARVRAMIGLKETAGAWLTAPSENVKFTHTAERYTYGLSLMPARSAVAYCKQQGFEEAADLLVAFNVCPWSSRGCRQACLATAGKGCMDSVKAGRTARTLLWAVDPDAAYTLTVHHIRKAMVKHGPAHVAIRLNTLSDVEWERVLPPAFWQEFRTVQFYDYTKSKERALHGKLPSNYDLTYSASESDSFKDLNAIAYYQRVAVVIGQHPDAPKPAEWNGHKVWDGNATDARYLEPNLGFVLLGALGKAKALPVGEREFVKPVRVA